MASSARSVFAVNVRRFRDDVGLTVEEAASHLGVSFHTVTSWEKGTREPLGSILVKLAALYGRDPAAFYRAVDGESADGAPSVAIALRVLANDIEDDLRTRAKEAAREINREYRARRAASKPLRARNIR